jgi:hypothetical protein
MNLLFWKLCYEYLNLIDTCIWTGVQSQWGEGLFFTFPCILSTYHSGCHVVGEWMNGDAFNLW